MLPSRHRLLSGQPGQRILLGIGVILLGCAVLVDNLQLFQLPMLRSFWPLGLVLLGLGRFIAPTHAGNGVFGTALILVGLLLTARNLGLTEFALIDWWPVFIILAGVSILVRGLFPGDGGR